MYNIFGLRVPDFSNNMVIEKDQVQNLTNLSINKVRCCHFDEGNLQFIDVVKDLKITTGPS